MICISLYDTHYFGHGEVTLRQNIEERIIKWQKKNIFILGVAVYDYIAHSHIFYVDHSIHLYALKFYKTVPNNFFKRAL
jgi:hypothetical protein